jgi:hypothetical protein
LAKQHAPARVRDNHAEANKALASLRIPAARVTLEDLYKNSAICEYKEAAAYQLDLLDAMK